MKNIDVEHILDVYNKTKSIRKTAKLTGYSYPTCMKYIRKVLKDSTINNNIYNNNIYNIDKRKLKNIDNINNNNISNGINTNNEENREITLTTHKNNNTKIDNNSIIAKYIDNILFKLLNRLNKECKNLTPHSLATNIGILIDKKLALEGQKANIGSQNVIFNLFGSEENMRNMLEMIRKSKASIT